MQEFDDGMNEDSAKLRERYLILMDRLSLGMERQEADPLGVSPELLKTIPRELQFFALSSGDIGIATGQPTRGGFGDGCESKVGVFPRAWHPIELLPVGEEYCLGRSCKVLDQQAMDRVPFFNMQATKELEEIDLI